MIERHDRQNFLRELQARLRDTASQHRKHKFLEALGKRLEKGSLEYGDASFAKPCVELFRELQQEALDRAGWAYVLWRKVGASIREGCTYSERTPEVVVQVQCMALAAAAFESYVADYEGLAAACQQIDTRGAR